MSVAENLVMKVYPWIRGPKIQKPYEVAHDIDQKRRYDTMEKISEKKANQYSSSEKEDDWGHVHTCITQKKSIKRL